MRTTLPLFLLLAALASGAAFVSRAGAQTSPAAPAGLNATAGLNASERALVEGSREAIIKTGMTADFFDRHFSVARVFDRPGDRRVVWKFSVGGYETIINDSIGSYMEAGRRVDTHSVAATLNSTSDMTRTISRRRAEAVMRRCIGRFTNPRVEYRARSAGGTAALLLTAQRVIPPRPLSPREARARREREEKIERELRARSKTGRVKREEDEDEAGRPVILLGAVDLVTGSCEVARAQSTP